MALTIEWRKRVDRWRKELPEHFYRKLGVVELEGFATRDQLSPDEAARGKFRSMPRGTAWGAKWEYGWFRTSVSVPKEAAGRRFVIRLEAGGHALIFVDGRTAGSWDNGRKELTLAMRARAGQKFDILAEAYAGHGPWVCHAGPTPPDRQTVPEPGPTQATVGETSFGIWEEDVYQLWIDVETLVALRDNIDADSLRVAEIDEALREFTRVMDFELPRDEMLKSAVRARKCLRPLLECRNGSTAPELFAFGHAHLDVAWLWPLAETERKAARTLANQLELAEEYPEYRFLHSQAHLFRMVKQRYPELYKRVAKAARAGKVIADGGMWVEADTNVSGGEALIRQFMHGKRFFREEFGVESELLWLPDVFGYSAAMPQIMRGCGVKYFATAKIFWNYNGGDPFPHNTFQWEGLDGSQVIVHLCNDYNSQTDPGSSIRRWRERVQKDGISTRLYPFGWGDGGGGPTRNHIEYVRRQKDLEGVPRVRMSSPAEYFNDLERRGVPNVCYVGELYYQCHRGTFTSQARTKRGNRKSELALREAEMWAAAAATLKGFRVPAADLDAAWKKVLLNQFHDILPGSSIARVYAEAERDHAEVQATAGGVARAAEESLAGKGGDGLSVFNSLAWRRTGLVALPKGWSGAAGADGQTLPTQEVGDEVTAEVSVPSSGWTTITPQKGAAAKSAGKGGVKTTSRRLENDLLRVEFGTFGEITSIIDKESGRELAAGPCNAFRMYKDRPIVFDAWDIESMYTEEPVELKDKAEMSVAAEGPLVGAIRVRRRLHESTMEQEIRLRRGSRRIEFVTRIDWQERHKLLKVAFPVTIRASEALHEIQFGHLARPNHQSRPFDADRFEVAQHKWTALVETDRGCAVLNDCKYGVSTLGNSINLTLLKSPMAPDMNADRGVQEVTYAFTAWNGGLADSPMVREGYELNVPLATLEGGSGEASLLAVDAPNVIIETVKPAEDGSGDVIVRLYESKRMTTKCRLSTALPATAASRCDMLENEIAPVGLCDGAIELDLRPFEVATVRLAMGGTKKRRSSRK